MNRYPWPPPDESIRTALEAAYRDGSWGQYDGPHGARLEKALREHFAAQHVQLCSSGTIAVELALRGCGVQAGDEVILGAYDFPGNFRAIEAIGARPVLVDVDAATWTIDPTAVAEAGGEGVTAVVVSHLHGGLADMPAICSMAAEQGWKVVEDACQSPGATVAGRPAGAWGDVAVLSFGGSKLLTAGRGGAVLTSDPLIHQRGKRFAERGNRAFPLSELQAAVLLPQLDQLQHRNQRRAAAVAEVRKVTSQVAELLRPMAITSVEHSAFYKHAWSFVPAECDGRARDELLAQLWSHDAPIDAGFRGFAGRSTRRCRRPDALPVSTALSQSTLLLHHPVLLAGQSASPIAAAAVEVAEVLVEAVRRSI